LKTALFIRDARHEPQWLPLGNSVSLTRQA
jgi:hypothetical protein